MNLSGSERKVTRRLASTLARTAVGYVAAFLVVTFTLHGAFLVLSGWAYGPHGTIVGPFDIVGPQVLWWSGPPFLACVLIAEGFGVRRWAYYGTFAIVPPFAGALSFGMLGDPLVIVGLFCTLLGSLIYWAIAGRHAEGFFRSHVWA